jgi:hypothetical protein
MRNLAIKALNIETWQDFERLVQKHNGVWGGCWCTAFHPKPPEKNPGSKIFCGWSSNLSRKSKSAGCEASFRDRQNH